MNVGRVETATSHATTVVLNAVNALELFATIYHPSLIFKLSPVGLQ